MPTLEELLKESGGEYVPVNGYVADKNYTDSQVIDIKDRLIGDIIDQTSTTAENRSQLLTFRVERRPDGYDLTKTTMKIAYRLVDGTGGESAPINVQANSEFVKLSWLVPASATQRAGNIQIMVYAVAANYTYKTLPKAYEIKETLEIGGTITEPDEAWYTDFVRQMDEKVSEAANSATAASQSAAAAEKAEAETKQAKDNALAAITDKCSSYAEIDKIKNVTLSGSAEGNYISVDDAASWRLSNLEVQGKSEQVQTTGKNLLDISGIANVTTAGITLTNQGDGTISVRGTATSYVPTNTTPLNLPAGDYYVNSNLAGLDAIVRYTKNGVNTYRSNTAFTLDGTETNIIFYMQVNTGSTVNGIAKPMLNKGVVPATWEPYTGAKPAPSPDYPQEIKSVENPVITACGKNLFNIGKVKKLEWDVTTGYKKTILCLEPNQTYIFSISENNFAGSGSYCLITNDANYDGYSNGAYKYAWIGHNTSERLNQTQVVFTAPSDGIMYFAITGSYPENFYTLLPNAQLKKDNIESTYEPYTGHTATLQDITLRSLPDGTADRLEKRNGVWGIDRTVGTKTYAGNETWSPYSDRFPTAFYTRNAEINANGRKNGYANRLQMQITPSSSVIDGCTVGANDKAIYITLSIKNITTVDGLKAWLQENPLTVQYELENHTWEPLPDTLQAELNKLESYAGTTNIFTDSPLQPVMRADYIKDPNKVLTAITNAITSLGGNL